MHLSYKTYVVFGIFLCFLLTFWTVIQFQLGIGDLDESRHPEKSIVAFVLAGSARSLRFPHVHRSIVLNLVEAFCPDEECIPHVFIRLSFSDNTHDGAGSSSKGIALPVNQTVMHEVFDAIDYMNQSIVRMNGLLHLERVDIGSVLERRQQLHDFDGIRHKIFREFDPRRYSMYFNRYRAYKMATDYEIEMHRKFTWIVHARLDAAWGEPIRPHHCWTTNQVWVPNMWYTDVPDIFAILPRQLSDHFYCMDLLVSPKAMCLGGNNFNNAVLQERNLTALGFSPEEVNVTLSMRCSTMFPDVEIIQNVESINDWSVAGLSEQILYNKLRLAGISREENSLAYAHLFTVVVRDVYNAPNPMCNYLEADRLFPFLENSKFDFHSRSAAPFYACHFMLLAPQPANSTLTTNHLRAVTTKRGVSTYQSKSYAMSSLFPSTSAIAPLSQGCAASRERDRNIWNFMPFRLSILTQHCLSVHVNWTTDSGWVGYADLDRCVDHTWHDRSLTLYSTAQMLHFHPIDGWLQPIKYLQSNNIDNAELLCLTVDAADWSLQFTVCQHAQNEGSQLFRVHQFSGEAPAGVGFHQQKHPRKGMSRDHAVVYAHFDVPGTGGRRQTRCLCGRSLRRASRSALTFLPCNVTRLSRGVGSRVVRCSWEMERMYTTGAKVSSANDDTNHLSHHLSPNWNRVRTARQESLRN